MVRLSYAQRAQGLYERIKKSEEAAFFSELTDELQDLLMYNEILTEARERDKELDDWCERRMEELFANE